MEYVKQLIDLVLHVDRHLDSSIQSMGPWIYVLLFAIVFAETGLVVTPFLPGDSLLFAIGALAARPDGLNLLLCLALLTVAAILGDSVNYAIGRRLGPGVFTQDSRWLKRQHLDKTQDFYARYGGKTIVIARFVPIVRTFAPFVAGVARMNYGKFMSFNIAGGFLWIFSLTLLGYFFGNFPIVKKNFGLVVIAIIILSILPAAIEVVREWRKRK